MNKDVKSSLDGVLLKPERRSGNTTRIIDNAIQIIFDGYICQIQDHNSKFNHQNKTLFLLVKKRLDIEYQSELNDYFIYDESNMQISINKKYLNN